MKSHYTMINVGSSDTIKTKAFQFIHSKLVSLTINGLQLNDISSNIRLDQNA